MHFLPDVYIKCSECNGKKYNDETLAIKYKGKSIYDVLEMSVVEALEFFQNIPNIRHKLELMNDVGLGYIKLGTPATKLSGGEAQRIKLAKFLQKRTSNNTLLILDEPTTGLHTHDIKNLINVLNRIVDHGATIIVIEHNFELIKCADHIIDLGPDGGELGGKVIATGTPEQLLAKANISYTAEYLKKYCKP
jgi:excinuclease ABC subunit A